MPARTGRPYPLRVIARSGRDTVTIDFLDVGKPVTLKAPPAAKVIDMAKLAAGE